MITVERCYDMTEILSVVVFQFSLPCLTPQLKAFKCNHGFKIQPILNSRSGKWNIPNEDYYLLKMA